MHEHPCAPHLNPCSQLRSSTSEGIQHQPHLPAAPLQFWASKCIRWSHLAVLPPPERKQHPHFCLKEGKRSAASQARSLHGGPRGSQHSPAVCSLGRLRVGPRSAGARAPLLLVRLKKQEGETACSNWEKTPSVYTGKSESLEERKNF